MAVGVRAVYPGTKEWGQLLEVGKDKEQIILSP